MAVLETVRRHGSIDWPEYVDSRQGKKVWVCSKLREHCSRFCLNVGVGGERPSGEIMRLEVDEWNSTLLHTVFAGINVSPAWIAALATCSFYVRDTVKLPVLNLGRR